MFLSNLLIWLLTGCGPAADDIVANLSSKNPIVREDTAKIARNTDDIAVHNALITALQDPEEGVRLNAIASLVELEVLAAVAPLITVVGSDLSALVQRDAVDALGRLGDPSAVPALVDYVESRPSKPPLNAIWALGALQSGSSLELLAKLRKHPDPYVSWNAKRALRNLRP